VAKSIKAHHQQRSRQTSVTQVHPVDAAPEVSERSRNHLLARVPVKTSLPGTATFSFVFVVERRSRTFPDSWPLAWVSSFFPKQNKSWVRYPRRIGRFRRPGDVLRVQSDRQRRQRQKKTNLMRKERKCSGDFPR